MRVEETGAGHAICAGSFRVTEGSISRPVSRGVSPSSAGQTFHKSLCRLGVSL